MTRLSAYQVHKFLVETIKFSNWKSALENKKGFLRDFVRLTGIHTHYENITHGGQHPSEWRFPSVEDVISQIMETGGGACIYLNYFNKLVLEHLGFNTYVVAADITYPPLLVPRNHCMTIVRLATDDGGEEFYLVDHGFAGRPFTEPVNLSKLPYVGRGGGFDFEYRFNDELQRYERVGHKGCSLTGPYKPGVSTIVECFLRLKPDEFEDFYPTFHILATDPTKSYYLNTTLISRFTVNNSPTDYELVTFRGKVLNIATAETRREEKFESYRAMQPRIEELFPRIDPKRLAAALHRYDTVKKAPKIET